MKSDLKVRIYCDNELVQTITALKTMPYDFEIDVSGVNNIAFELSCDMGSISYAYLALTDLALYE